MTESMLDYQSLILVILSEKKCHTAVNKTFLRLVRREYTFWIRMQCRACGPATVSLNSEHFHYQDFCNSWIYLYLLMNYNKLSTCAV